MSATMPAQLVPDRVAGRAGEDGQGHGRRQIHLSGARQGARCQQNRNGGNRQPDLLGKDPGKQHRLAMSG